MADEWLQRLTREREDAEIARVVPLVDAMAAAMSFRKLILELSDPPADIVAAYRTAMLQIHDSLINTAQAVVDEDRRGRA